MSINIDGVLYLRIMDPYKASYGVEDPEFAITQLAQTTMRSELGKISLGKWPTTVLLYFYGTVLGTVLSVLLKDSFQEFLVSVV